MTDASGRLNTELRQDGSHGTLRFVNRNMAAMPASGLSGSGNASRETEGGDSPVKPKQKPSEAMSTCWTC